LAAGFEASAGIREEIGLLHLILQSGQFQRAVGGTFEDVQVKDVALDGATPPREFGKRTGLSPNTREG